MSWPYIAVGLAWLVITVLLAIYITGWRMRPEQHISVGFKLMAVSYFLGGILLFILATWLN